MMGKLALQLGQWEATSVLTAALPQDRCLDVHELHVANPPGILQSQILVRLII